MVEDLTRARNRLTKFLLRHSRVWRGGSNWTLKHEAWLAAQRFDEPALQTTFEHYRAVVLTRDAQLAAIESDLKSWIAQEPFAGPVRRLAAYRGVTAMGALSLQAEVCDWRRFGRAAQVMGFVGLVPSERSSGGSSRRGHITKAGNTHLRAQLVESAWAYQHPRMWAPRSPNATMAWPPRSSPGPGPRSCGCVGGSVTSPPARTSSPWSRPQSPGSSPGSCGPR